MCEIEGDAIWRLQRKQYKTKLAPAITYCRTFLDLLKTPHIAAKTYADCGIAPHELNETRAKRRVAGARRDKSTGLIKPPALPARLLEGRTHQSPKELAKI
ncbi:hypothetical protein EVAR_32153_1 [Eumeta japonica]|uniref:Uncharacterized protein n=1 Tax=Eumeta variegata TaxID=151549 RepID=A0A4C1W0H0_EUMVA|nr:hypothetical protein EVAR_32153_1 [Eumeta japonica]